MGGCPRGCPKGLPCRCRIVAEQSGEHALVVVVVQEVVGALQSGVPRCEVGRAAPELFACCGEIRLTGYRTLVKRIELSAPTFRLLPLVDELEIAGRDRGAEFLKELGGPPYRDLRTAPLTEDRPRHDRLTFREGSFRARSRPAVPGGLAR